MIVILVASITMTKRINRNIGIRAFLHILTISINNLSYRQQQFDINGHILYDVIMWDKERLKKLYKKIEEAKRKSLSGESLRKEELVELLEINAESQEAEALGAAASEVANKYTEKRARLWGAIGVDYKACDMNCLFCSLGSKWGIVKEEKEYDIEDMIRQVRYYVENGFYYIVLRTTEFYSVEKIGTIIKKIRNTVHGDYILGCNIGELDTEQAAYLCQCGGELAYHCLRLREGKDTKFRIEDRIKTLEVIRDSKMKLGFWVEPVGLEHTNEEIADKILQTLEYNTDVCGVMARVPVHGTPLGHYPQISDKRLAQIIAVLRLASGAKVSDICVHPASELSVRYGANVLVLETGAIPRDAVYSDGYWTGLSAEKAKEWLQQGGYYIERSEGKK